MTKRAKRFRKKLMSVGIGRNAANWGFRNGTPGILLLMHEIARFDIWCISNVATTRDGRASVRAKRIVRE